MADGSPKRNIFIAGCGHTGTTLMNAVLGSHPKICSIPEETEAFLRIQSTPELKEFFSAKSGEASKPCTYLCEKTPRHVHHLAKIFECFPDARVILMMRDGRDVVASLKFRTRQLLPSIERWLRDTQATLAWKDDPRVRIVTYESFIEDPKAVLAGICAFLGLAYDESMLRFHEDPREWRGAVAARIEPDSTAPDGTHNATQRARRNRQIHQPIFDARGTWRTGLTADDLAAFDRLAGGLMEDIGYYDPARGESGNG